MGSRLWLICLLLAMAVVAECSNNFGYEAGLTGTCDPAYGNCVGTEEDEMAMDSEINHRLLAAHKRYISYGALRRDSVPCSRRGQSYYNCTRMRKANPYKRGCSTITRCKRFTD